MYYNNDMNDFLLSLDFRSIIALAVALLLGALVGLERSVAGKTAGMRTFALVSMGSTLFVIIARMMVADFLGPDSADAILRVIASVITGIGFLGAGLIIFGNQEVKGLTTAAGLWVSAGIGVAVGMGFYLISITAVLLTLFTLRVLWYIEHKAKEYTNTTNEKV